MKKRFFIYSVLAALLMTGCSKSEEDLLLNEEAVNGEAVNGENGENGDVNTSYLTVNLMSADGGAGARATRADGDYEYGTDAENEVKKVRFYFFTATGAAANVKLQGGTYVNYFDWNKDSIEQSKNPDGYNVGSKLSAKLVIQTPKGDKQPTLIAAVINPVETATSRSLSALKLLAKDYAAGTYTQPGTFVMFNSVYGNSEKSAEICAVSIKEENLAKTVKDATEHPVTIYVERSVAKVSVDMAAGFNATTGLLALKDKNDQAITVGGEQVYLKINGWKLTAETSIGNLVKNISNFTSWNTSDFSSWWNSYNNKRSYWAVNASAATNQYYTYNEITPTSTSYDFSAPLYTNENAEDFADGNSLNRTKVILSGTLCDAEGNSFTIVRHLGTLFTDTYSKTEADNLKNLKNNILAQLASDTKYYWKDGEEYNSITANDLEIRPVGTNGEESTPANDCFVYAQLTPAAKAKEWYSISTTGATPIEKEFGEINGKLENYVDKALVWNEGKTYYYYEIIHHTDNNDKKTPGVVRNHVYKTTVTKIAGLGTPVYDPDQVIYPEKPDPNDHYIAAQINILAWRIVTDNYELEW